jgi:Druantia protein DruA
VEAKLKYRGRVVTDADVAFIRKLVAENPMASRRALSKKLCQAWNWVQPNGALRDMVCRGLMLALYRAGHIGLPPVRLKTRNPLAERGSNRKRPAIAPAAEVDTTPLSRGLAEIRPLEFRQVRRTPEEPLFNSLLERYHFLGYIQPVGEYLKYLVYGLGRPLACLAWSSAPRHLAPRDRYIGWSAEARRKNIRFVAYNTRFLLVPWADVPNLASHILGRMAGVLSRDWERIYRHPIYFLETFVDPQKSRGTCYRAANWVVLGRTTGRGKDSQSKRPNRSIKEVLGYATWKRFRELLILAPTEELQVGARQEP